MEILPGQGIGDGTAADGRQCAESQAHGEREAIASVEPGRAPDVEPDNGEEQGGEERNDREDEQEKEQGKSEVASIRGDIRPQKDEQTRQAQIEGVDSEAP